MALSPFATDDDTTPDLGEDATSPVESAPEDVPPIRSRARRNRSSGSTEPPKKAPTRAPKSLTISDMQTQVQEMVGRAGVAIFMLGTMRNSPKIQYDGAVIGENAELLAKAVADAAEKSPKFKKTLEKMVAATGFGVLGATVVSVALPIAWNHGLVPKQLGFAIKHPDAFAPDVPDTPDMPYSANDDAAPSDTVSEYAATPLG